MLQQDASDQDTGDKDQERGGEHRRYLVGARLRSASPEETRRLGELLGRMLAAGDIVLLTGALGAGKTAFTQGIGAGLGVVETINSPTFTIVKEYAGRLPLYHFDLYRIDEPDELYALGFEEYFGGDAVAVVEWAERGEDRRGEQEGGAIWPSDWVRVTLRANTMQPNERTLDLAATGVRGQALLAGFLTALAAAGQGGTSTDDARGVSAATEGV